MATYRVQIGFQLDSTLPRDLVTINPHFNGDNPQALGDALKNNLIGFGPLGPTMPFTVKVYDALKPPPSYPLYTVSNGTGAATTAKPREVAMCLSYYSTYNRPTYRGRLYIPCGLIPGGLALRPTQSQIDSVLSWKTVFTNSMPAQHNWVIFSPKRGQADGVNHVWVDDEWDTVRSRGLKSTARTTGTVP